MGWCAVCEVTYRLSMAADMKSAPSDAASRLAFDTRYQADLLRSTRWSPNPAVEDCGVGTTRPTLCGRRLLLG